MPLELFLHPVARQILDTKIRSIAPPSRWVFRLPTANGANKSLKAWNKNAGINKYITWKDGRLSFSILLRDANVDAATVALLLGYSTTRYVNETYKRFRPKNQQEHIMKLPEVE
jgi:integrase/recombinase XerD